ncbi:putative 2OG-Fe(II) oxygenase [Novosphingobium lentum]|uniref:putative 2OG-Fe(II) oxygenase n=1 Tax=Novosphingobium lentum TaxID=145287 RepID=UPI0008307487|nr:putative 2OG-Fe(II) oxygenase [Novosphingobium lentum]
MGGGAQRPTDAAGWLARAVTCREAQRMAEALDAIRHAAALAPNEPNIALGLAQLHYEAGLPAAELFATAAGLLPGRLDVMRNAALALAAEGDAGGGEHLLAATLVYNPGWIDGHRALAGLRATAGDLDHAQSFAEAVQRDPGNVALRLGWFHVLAVAKEWDAAREVLEDARQNCGESRALTLSQLFVQSESGEGADDPALFDAVEAIEDPGLDLARVRHFLRGGQVERAVAIAARHIGKPSIRPFWPYLSLGWRLTGDPRAQWLDDGMERVATYDLAFTAPELADLAALLRRLHTARAPYHEQSVRGGTQTDRPLLLRLDPAIALARSRIEGAVRRYIDALPPADHAHPLLSCPREDFRFSGSWSVRLRGPGYHAAHTHPMGWISSAFYVALPEPSPQAEGSAGNLRFGTPPPELGLPLDAYGEIAPKAGRLALFPSTMWHGTVPCSPGERLTIAFDVVPAPAPAGQRDGDR